MLKVVEIMLGEVGYHEKASNAYLDDPTANAGSGNYTKYARDLDALGYFYNGPKQGYAYCDVTVDWAFVQAYGVKRALELLCQPEYSAGAGCLYSAQYYKNRGCWSTVPHVGDQIFFTYSPGEVSHTGLVYAVDSNYVYTVEGNTSDQVAKRQYAIGNSTIYGYGHPAYSDEELNGTGNDAVSITETLSEASTVQTYTAPTQTMTVELPLLKRYHKGNAVGALQWLLVYDGYLTADDVDGFFGENTENAVKQMQGDFNLEADGEVGMITWNALIVD